MKLGAHNSFTYLKPRKWYTYPIKFTAQCQEVDIYEQYEKYGVRVFDLRIRKGSDGKVVLAHGLVEYKNSPEELSKALAYLDDKGDVMIRVLHEVRTFWQKSDEQVKWFVSYCATLEKTYERIAFFGGCDASSGEKLFIFKHATPSSDGFHASWETKCKLDDLYPKLYAKKNNRKWYERGSDKEVMFLDFVNIK